jgi:hypothetical protein
MIIGTPVYDGVDLLDVISPHKMLHWMSQSQIDVDIRLIAEQAGPIKTATGFTICRLRLCRRRPAQRAVGAWRRSGRAAEGWPGNNSSEGRTL